MSRSYLQNKVVVVTVSLLEAEQHFHSVLIIRLASALNPTNSKIQLHHKHRAGYYIKGVG